MSASAGTASDIVMAILCDLIPADAVVRPHEGCSDTQTNGDPQLLVPKAEPEIGAWQCVEPGT